MPLDYRPDYDPTTPGVLTSVVDMIPTRRGYKVARYPTELSGSAHFLTLAVNESAVNALFATPWLTAPGGMVFAGTNQNLYIYTLAAGFENVSKAGGYALAPETSQFGEDPTPAFDMCAFGNICIATHKTERPQYRDATDTSAATKFADLGTTTTAPKAAVCASSSNFVFLGDLDTQWGNTSPTTGTRDMVAWSAIGDHQDWDSNPTVNESSWQRFVDTPGPITALARWRDGIIVFKLNAMYYGRYVGGGVVNSPIWEFERISDRIGCVGPRSWIDIGDRLIFVGGDGDAYQFDGSRPRSITDGLRMSHFRRYLAFYNETAVMLGHDRYNGCVNFHTAGQATLVWCYLYDKWSTLQSENNGSGLSQAISLNYNNNDVPMRTSVNSFKTVTANTDGTLTLSTGLHDLYAAFAIGSQVSVGGLTLKCKIYTRSTNPSDNTYSNAATMTTGAIGHDEDVTTYNRVAPKFANAVYQTTYATCLISTKSSLGEAWTDASTPVSMNDRRRFDLMAEGVCSTNWVRFHFTWGTHTGLSNPTEVLDIGFLPKPAGKK